MQKLGSNAFVTRARAGAERIGQKIRRLDTTSQITLWPIACVIGVAVG